MKIRNILLLGVFAIALYFATGAMMDAQKHHAILHYEQTENVK